MIILIYLIVVGIVICLAAAFMALRAWGARRPSAVEAFLKTNDRYCPQPVRINGRRGARFGLCLTPPRLAVMGTSSLLVAAVLGMAASRANPGVQIAELEAYALLAGHPRQVLQVDLARHRSFSQYHPRIVSPAAGDFGGNACGLIATAQAVVVSQNPGLAGTEPGFNAVVNLMRRIRAEAIRPDGKPAYAGETGIQPSHLVGALRDSQVGSYYDITSRNDWTLSPMYQALAEGHIVIVDVRVRRQTEVPSTTPDTFAHFARVLGMDLDRREIYIENTLEQREGRAYWTLTLEDFMAAWQYPETGATSKPSEDDPTIREEAVTHWAVVMKEKE